VSELKITVHGNPTEAEVAAIVAAVEMSWPKPAAGVSAPPQTSTAWRYAGRWWQDGRLPARW
jgi:hypothetical protein